MNLVEDFTYGDIVSVLHKGLQEGKLLSTIKRTPKTYGEFLIRAHEFIDVEEYL